MHNQTSNETFFNKQSAEGMHLGRHLSYFHYCLYSFCNYSKNPLPSDPYQIKQSRCKGERHLDMQTNDNLMKIGGR